LIKAKYLIDGMTVDTARMRANIDGSFGLVFSQAVLLALVAAGMPRDDAYRIVQRNAMTAWETEQSFRSLLDADPEVTASPEVLDTAFDLNRSLRNAHRFQDALTAL
jgi:adenylosuccinate lyase